MVWVAEGRQSSSLEEFMRKLKRKGVRLEAVAMDMWPAYIKVVKKYYPEEVIVSDRYHIIQECNRMLDELRRDEASKVLLRKEEKCIREFDSSFSKGKKRLREMLKRGRNLIYWP